jgi:hypothetical protein
VSCQEVPEMDHSVTQFCERGELPQRVFAALFDVPAPEATLTPPAPIAKPEGQECGHC